MTEKGSSFWRANPRFSRLRLRHLEALLILEDSTSFHDAARKMNVAQPTMSALIRDVEEAFGVQLYDRSHNGIRSNEYTAFVAERVQRLLTGAETLVQDLNVMTSAGLRSIRIGVMAHAMLTLIPRLVSDPTFKSANLALQVHEASAESLLEQMARGNLDCVIAISPTVLSESFVSAETVSEPLYDYGTFIVGPKEHDVWKNGIDDLNQLAKYRWALPPQGSLARKSIDQTFLVAGAVPPTPVVEMPSIAYGLHFAAHADLLVCISWPNWADPVDDDILHSAPFPTALSFKTISIIRMVNDNQPAVEKLIKVLNSLDWLDYGGT